MQILPKQPWSKKLRQIRYRCSPFFYLAIFLVFWRFWRFLVPKKGIRQTFFKKWILLSCSAWKTMQFSFSHHRLKINILWLPEQAHRFTGYLISHPVVPRYNRVKIAMLFLTSTSTHPRMTYKVTGKSVGLFWYSQDIDFLVMMWKWKLHSFSCWLR